MGDRFFLIDCVVDHVFIGVRGGERGLIDSSGHARLGLHLFTERFHVAAGAPMLGDGSFKGAGGDHPVDDPIWHYEFPIGGGLVLAVIHFEDGVGKASVNRFVKGIASDEVVANANIDGHLGRSLIPQFLRVETFRRSADQEEGSH